MSEEEKEAIVDLKEILKEWQKIVDIKDPTERDIEMSMYIEEMPFYQIKTLLNLIEKQQKEIEKLKTDKKNASEYIREEMYIDENPTLDDDNTITELPISLSLCNEDLRKLLELLEENK